MNDQLTDAADDLVTLTPEQIDKIDRLITRWQCAVNALRVLATRSYFSAEQAAMIRAEADELVVTDIEPLWAALRDGTLSTTVRATVEKFGEAKSSAHAQRPLSEPQ